MTPTRTPGSGTDRSPDDRRPDAALEWGEDVSPEAAGAVDFLYDRVYGAWRTDALAATEDQIATIGRARVRSEEYLTAAEREILKRLEKEIVAVERGDGSIDETRELDAAWCDLLLEGIERAHPAPVADHNPDADHDPSPDDADGDREPDGNEDATTAADGDRP